MKKAKQLTERHVYLGMKDSVCCKCHHIRKDEPYVEEVYYGPSGRASFKQVCWRCCRDAESTLLIKQKWPIAFVRLETPRWWLLDWAPGIKDFVEASGETPKLT